MQLVRSSFGKNKAQAVRKASCARGGLRIFIQSIFAVITVTSFILIVLMSIGKPSQKAKRPLCVLQTCTIVCQTAPFDNKYEENLLLAVTEGSTKCFQIAIDLQEPVFEDGKLPVKWLNRMPANLISSLSIKSGSLKYLTCGAFMSPFAESIETFTLEDLNLKYWAAHSLVGLTNLQTLNVVNSSIKSLQTNALRAVDNTLRILSFTRGGAWDPTNLTGFRGLEKLSTVNLSDNEFHNILVNGTFAGLDRCRILYLNNCKIISIGAGTFDNLVSIEVLYLNNNYLQYIPTDLFKNIIAIEHPRPRIHLLDNLWHCSCTDEHLRELVTKEVLLVDAKCVAPKEMNDKTFTEFHNSCKNKNNFKDKIKKMVKSYKQKNVQSNFQLSNGFYTEQNLCDDAPNSKLMRVNSLSVSNKCAEIPNSRLSSIAKYRYISNGNWTDWLQSSTLIRTDRYTVVQLSTSTELDYGILWYQSSCPNQVYCIDTIPSVLRLYSVHLYTQYTFCPVDLASSDVIENGCIYYGNNNDTSNEKIQKTSGAAIFAYIIVTGLLCLIWGAAIVYGLIRRNPNLLRGSKRIVFVKHKNVSALVLPPKIPLRTDLFEEKKSEENVFTISSANKLDLPKFDTIKSVQSVKSVSPSYISALQPTDDQLAEWRSKSQLNNDPTDCSTKSELSAESWVSNTYYSLDEKEATYESLK